MIKLEYQSRSMGPRRVWGTHRGLWQILIGGMGVALVTTVMMNIPIIGPVFYAGIGFPATVSASAVLYLGIVAGRRAVALLAFESAAMIAFGLTYGVLSYSGLAPYVAWISMWAVISFVPEPRYPTSLMLLLTAVCRSFSAGLCGCVVFVLCIMVAGVYEFPKPEHYLRFYAVCVTCFSSSFIPILLRTTSPKRSPH